MAIRLETAYKMAIECMERERRERYSFQRNLAIRMRDNVTPTFRIAREKYDKMTEAMEMLGAEKNRLTTKE